MGRYYQCNQFYGKFGFGVQGSDDPEYFGMQEQNPSHIPYYMHGSKENIEYVTKKLDKQYDIIGLKQEDRLYEIENDKDDRLNFLEEKIDILRFRLATDKDENKISYAMDNDFLKKKGWDEESRVVAVSDEVNLAACRVYLGLRILSSLKQDGYCDLEAEL